MKEFLRFGRLRGALVSVIEPKALILESLAPHFTGRFPEEQFMIFDKTHGFALFYRPYEWVVRPVSELALPSRTHRSGTSAPSGGGITTASASRGATTPNAG